MRMHKKNTVGVRMFLLCLLLRVRVRVQDHPSARACMCADANAWALYIGMISIESDRKTILISIESDRKTKRMDQCAYR